MNSYNDNLHSSVVNALKAQELALQQLKTTKDAASFSMYYAQGARITAEENVEKANIQYGREQKVNNQAIIDSDSSTNVITSANNIKTYVTKTASNTTVAAANVQIAANAILKLTSDTGSIFSIVSAADFDTDIYAQAKDAYDRMNETAYLAEKTSQFSMEASAAIAEIPSNALDQKAQLADSSMKNLLSTTNKELEDASNYLLEQTDTLATSSTTEKESEGDLEVANANYNAAQTAYNLSIAELNHSLKVTVPHTVGDATKYKVSFSPYKSPFPKTTPKNGGKGYPVEKYYIILTKYSKSETFSITEAENIIQGTADGNDQKQYIAIDPKTIDSKGKINHTIYINTLLDSDNDKLELGKDYTIFIFVELKNEYKKKINTFDDYLTAPSARFNLTNKISAAVTESIEVSKISNEKDGDTQKLGFSVWQDKDYSIAYKCLFLPHKAELINDLLTVEGLDKIEAETESLEEIADKYDPKIATTKQKINTENSELTSIDTQINEVNAQLKAKDLKDPQKAKLIKELNDLSAKQTNLKDSIKLLKEKLKLLEDEKASEISKVEHRGNHIKPGFYFDTLIAEQVPAGCYTLAKSNKTLAPAINAINSFIDAFDTQIKHDDIDHLETQLNLSLEKFNTDLDKLYKDVYKLSYQKTIDGIVKVLDKIISDDITIHGDLKDLFVDIKKLKAQLKRAVTKLINFVKTLTTKEEVAEFLQLIKTLKNGVKFILKGYYIYSKEMILEPETTDNFGNRLITTNLYIPAILSVSSNSSLEVNNQFTNALSNFQNTSDFNYKAQNNLNTTNH